MSFERLTYLITLHASLGCIRVAGIGTNACAGVQAGTWACVLGWSRVLVLCLSFHNRRHARTECVEVHSGRDLKGRLRGNDAKQSEGDGRGKSERVSGGEEEQRKK